MSIYYTGPKIWGQSYIRNPANALTTINYNTSGVETSRSTQNYTSAFTLYYRRDKHSNNPIVYVTPQRVPWRRPSSYIRTLIRMEYDESTYTRMQMNGFPSRTWTGRGQNVATSSVLGPHISAALAAIIDSNTRNRLNTEVLNKLQDQKVDFGTALAEMRSTVSGVASTFGQGVRAVLAAKHGNWAGVAKALRVKPKSLASGGAFSERWLEYQFGWMPLFADLHGGYELIHQGLREKGLLMSASRSYNDSVEFGSSSTNWEIKGRSSIQSRVKLHAAVNNAAIANLAQWGFLNPAQIAWELVPYSFVVDWFMPVGNLISACGATRGLSFVGGFSSTRVSSECEWTYYPERSSSYRYEGEGFSGRCWCESYDRTAMSTFPMPSIYFKSPFSTSHVTSALALLRQLIKSR